MTSLAPLPHETPASPRDLEIMRLQLGRDMRGVVSIARRCACGRPAVVRTAPRLEDGTPFPTSLYLTLPSMVAAVSRLEARGEMAELTADAMPRLASMKAMPEYWVEINRLENEGDVIYRTLLRDLFGGAVTDPVEIIKHKDIIERLEQAADAFERVAHRVETIAIKES